MMVKGTMISSSRLVLNITAACALVLTIAGCQSKTAPTKENYLAALNTYYAGHDDCLFPGGLRLPYSVSSKPGAASADSGAVSEKSLEALKDAGMLDRTEDKDLHVNRYTLSTAGARATSRFCFGHRVISSIDSSTEPAKVNGFPETQIEYHYTLMDVPVWAKSDAIQATFPEMGKAIKGEGTGKARLSQTLAGWQVPE